MHRRTDGWEALAEGSNGSKAKTFWDRLQITDTVMATPHHKSPLDEINEIRRNAADSLWVLKVTRRRILPLTAII